MLLLTGLTIELALMPVVLFHFHRAGFYGALANVVAIPLVTFISMPLIALSLALDLMGLGAPAWWLVGQSLDLLLTIAHFTSGQPGAVKLMPQMDGWAFASFTAGGLWLALWQGSVRLWGLLPVAVGALALAATPAPDILISGDGTHVGVRVRGEQLLMLRESRSDYARDNLRELAGVDGETIAMERWHGASCSRDFCTLGMQRGERRWRILMARSRSRIEERALAAACDQADIVIADRWLPRSCTPGWLKADRRLLAESGGLALYLADAGVTKVAEGRSGHPWWVARGNQRRKAVSCTAAASPQACPAL
ncbi:hypothetical protein GCM10011515_10840 [Tsuneonella deserti]|uniref:ComEC/Rec2-related protein domain-containing protein n=1 Tax=Tsuneonella deserti TaxID=2035528 RepID=A0ABQ1S6X3_9SPHN|nr:ComEC/Rec2 family competence protein [Tsuneonella deserti]GGD92932.1 hypothetical protein GCM10011515_10840 [Tsuneonella deserti]